MALGFHMAFGPVLQPDFIFPDIEGTDRRDVDITRNRERISEPCLDEDVEWRTLGSDTADAALKALIGFSCASRFGCEAFPAQTEAAMALVHGRLTASGASRTEPTFGI